MEIPVQEVILEQYKIYNESKEAYIDRNFTTNRFYTILCLSILFVTYIVHIFTPEILIMLGVCTLGMFTSALWWLNVDTYNALIKIKYARVLEILEQSLPKQPFRDEFNEAVNLRPDKKTFVFADVQKVFASLIFLSFAVIAVLNAFVFLRRMGVSTDPLPPM